MSFLPFRFLWFTVRSWQYIGNWDDYRAGFWVAWKGFNHMYLCDNGKIDCCEHD